MGHTSNGFNTTCGLRWGSVISPILFNIYLDDLSKDLNNSTIGCKINNVLVNYIYYADDLVIISPLVKGLKNLIGKCVKFGKIHDVIFNCTKSKCILFKSSYKVEKPFIEFSPGQELEFVESINYLGVTISSNSKDNSEIANQYH